VLIERLGPLGRSDAVSTLTCPAARLDLSHAPEVIEMALEESEGYPLLLQVLGDVLWWGHAPAAGSVGRLRAAAVEALDRTFYSPRLAPASPRESPHMRRIARHGEGLV
jgi:hypothetical protein